MKTKLSSPMTVLESYVAAALWSEVDESRMCPLDDNYSITDLPQATLDIMAADLGKFMRAAYGLLKPSEYTDAAHYFWLTRNGHGSCFLDMETEHAEALYRLAHMFRECNLYTSRGWVYAY